MRTALAIAVAGIGCGPREPAASTTMLIFPGGALADRFQGRSPRLRVAREEIGALLGHRLEVRIDAAFEPRWAMASDEHIERIIVELGRTLKRVESRAPKLFAAYKDSIRVILYEFDATAREVKTTLDSEKKVLRIVATQDDSYGCACGGIESAMREVEDADQKKKFVGKEAAQVDAADLVEFAAWLREKEFFDAKKPAAELGEPGASNLRRELDVHARLPEGEAKRKSREHLLGRLHAVVDFRHSNTAQVTSVPKTSPWARLEAAYGAWLTKDAPTFSSEEKAELVGTLTRHPKSPELPTFDVVGFGFTMVEAWLQAGMPMEHYSADPGLRAMLDIVCPYWPADDGRIREHPSNCKGLWTYSLGNEARLSRAVTFLTSKHNGALVQAIFPNLVDEGNSGWRSGAALVPLWRKFSGDDASWAAATRVVGTTASPYDSEVLGETIRVLRNEPRRRGLVLFIRAASESELAVSRTKAERKADFERSYAQAISANELKDYFGHGILAFRYAHNLLPYLASGYSRFEAFSGALSAMLDGKATQEKAKYVARLANGLCLEGARSDLARLNEWLRTYVKRVPSDETALRTLVEQTAKPTCESVELSKERP